MSNLRAVGLIADGLADALDRLLPRTRFARALEHFMDQTNAALAELDEATTAVADRIDELIGNVEGVDATTAAAIAVQTSRLRGLAADPTNPVPTPPADGPDGL